MLTSFMCIGGWTYVHRRMEGPMHGGLFHGVTPASVLAHHRAVPILLRTMPGGPAGRLKRCSDQVAPFCGGRLAEVSVDSPWLSFSAGDPPSIRHDEPGSLHTISRGHAPARAFSLIRNSYVNTPPPRCHPLSFVLALCVHWNIGSCPSAREGEGGLPAPPAVP